MVCSKVRSGAPQFDAKRREVSEREGGEGRGTGEGEGERGVVGSEEGKEEGRSSKKTKARRRGLLTEARSFG